MTEDREGLEEARRVVVPEKEGYTTNVSVEILMESVESPEEEVKLNNLVPEPHMNSCKGHTSL